MALHDAELRHFGRRYSAGNSELKGTKLLKSKVFQHAKLNADVSDQERQSLAKAALDDGPAAGVRHLKALAQAKLNYVSEVFDICVRFRCQAFASIIEPNAPRPVGDGLRKDYAFLFERFFYYLEDKSQDESGIIVFDELDKAKSHILIEQTHRYFRDYPKGRHRAGRIVPEPFFVHSDLTTGIQIADLLAYVISWGFRAAQMKRPARSELASFVSQVAKLRYLTRRDLDDNPDFEIWSFAHIADLRPRAEREE